ncbi:MAG: hypothetical protein FWD65_04260 [Coriobacteriia bacterium]|nr:hypothetical protein [Coriobacteriia bacterium]
MKRYVRILLIVVVLLGIGLGVGWLFISTPKRKTHYYPAGNLASQTATAAVESYMHEGFVTHDQVRGLQVANWGLITDSSPAYKTFQGVTYEKVYEFGTSYDYEEGYFSPIEEDQGWFVLVAYNSQRNQWVVYGGGTGP